MVNCVQTQSAKPGVLDIEYGLPDTSGFVVNLFRACYRPSGNKKILKVESCKPEKLLLCICFGNCLLPLKKFKFNCGLQKT